MVLLSETKRLLLWLLLIVFWLLPTLPECFEVSLSSQQPITRQAIVVYVLRMPQSTSMLIYNNISAAVWSINLVKHNWKSVPDSEQLKFAPETLDMYCYYMSKPEMRYKCSAAVECTVNVSHYTIAYTTLIGVVGRKALRRRRLPMRVFWRIPFSRARSCRFELPFCNGGR